MILLDRDKALAEYEKLPDELKTSERYDKVLNNFTPFKLMQRVLAVGFNVLYVLAWAYVFMRGGTEQQFGLLEGTMAKIILSINLFYFMGGAISSTRKEN